MAIAAATIPARTQGLASQPKAPLLAVGRARRSGRSPTARCPGQRAEPSRCPQPVDVGVGSRLQLIYAARHVGQSEAARGIALRYAQRFAVLDGCHLCLRLRRSLGIDDLAVQYPRGLQGHVTHFGDRRPRRSHTSADRNPKHVMAATIVRTVLEILILDPPTLLDLDFSHVGIS